MGLVSVIIPIQNQEKRIKKCIYSVLQQTCRDFEILLLDDASTDSSPAICDRLAAKDKRIRVFHLEECGVAGTRNFGIEHARGDYITFIDADDYVAPDYIGKLRQVLENDSCEVSMCDYGEVIGNKCIIGNLTDGEKKLSAEEWMDKTLYNRMLGGCCWGKMWKKSAVRHMFQAYKYSEDELFCIENIAETQGSIALVPEVLYFYVRHPSSITAKKMTKNLEDTLKVAARVLELSGNNKRISNQAATALCINFAFFACLSTKENDEDAKKLQKECIALIKKYRCSVLKDPKAMFKTKAACLVSFVSMHLLKQVYNISNRKK